MDGTDASNGEKCDNGKRLDKAAQTIEGSRSQQFRLVHIASQNNKTEEKIMNNDYRYEKRPVRVRAIQAEFRINIKHPHGVDGYLTVEPGEWIVEPEGETVEIVSDEEFRKKYRIIRPDVSIRSSSAVGSDGKTEW